MERNRFGLAWVIITTSMVTFIISSFIFSSFHYFRPDSIVFDTDTVSVKQIQKFNQVRSILKSEYYKDVNESKLLEGAIAGMVASVGDRYTSYYNKEQWQMLQEDIEGEFTGIGIDVKIGSDGITVIEKVFEGSPAKKSGIMAGDKIFRIDGKDVRLEKLDGIVKLIKNRKTEDIKITVYRPSLENLLDFNMKLEKIKEENISSSLLPEKIGYIKIKKFDAEIAKFFGESLSKLKRNSISGLVIDVRDNPGGYYDQVAKIADALLPKCTIVYTEDKYKVKDIRYSDPNELGIPLVLLVNGNSASASEILAGAIKDNKFGKLVGTRTYGKGLVQKPVSFKDGSGFKLTVQRYFTPSGVCIQGKGIEPDIAVELDKKYDNMLVSDVPIEEDFQLKSAIEALKGEMQKHV